ncbi:hypothetical protein CTAYLR_005857 [Chrysophaeum taylorii]|uniref:Uncharacterized protein n=1 Tax=Chrysophaeum taylorii TaxID=2483200 RepID=A0AAD7UPS2_9STRA|nr:hypothetical protein CTAYLR_005857 [Chrysophaeum taylorii]
MGSFLLVVCGVASGLAPPGWREEARAAALVAGNMIGGGILAVPTAAHAMGASAAGVEIGALWAVNVATGLMLAEVASDGSSLREMAHARLGAWASHGTSIAFLGSNALLLGAYASEGGEAARLLSHGGESLVWPCAFAAACGALCGTERGVADANAAAVATMAACLAVMLATWLPYCAPLPPFGLDLEAAVDAAPVVTSALVFQNVVPVIARDLGSDKARTRRAVVLGSAFPALAYVAFTASILGRLGDEVVYGADGLIDPLAALPDEAKPISAIALGIFSLCAVATSFVGTALSQEHELRTLVDDRTAKLAALGPPLALALAGPHDLFFDAIAICGALANPLLFGALPVALFLAPHHIARAKRVLFDIKNIPTAFAISSDGDTLRFELTNATALGVGKNAVLERV